MSKEYFIKTVRTIDMKSRGSIIIYIISILFIVAGCGRSNDPGGYNDVKWGASIEDVKTKFGHIKKTDESIFDITEYKQVKINNNTIKSRSFKFKGNKLVEVYNMLSLDKETWKLALDKLNEQFGKYHDIEVERAVLDGQHKSEIVSFVWNMPKTKIIFRKVITPMREYGVSFSLYDIIYRDNDYVDFLNKEEKRIKNMRKNNIDL